MTIAIGGWLLLAIAHGEVPTLDVAIHHGVIVRGYDTAEDCEGDRKPGQVCVPALATVNR